MKIKVFRRGVFLFFAAVLSMCVAGAQQSAVTGLRLDHVDGSMSVMSDHLARGPVYVAFWATWCVPCVQELRALDRIMRRHPDAGFSVLAVNQDASKGMGKVKAFASAQGWTFPIVLDPNAQLLQVFNGRTLPFSVLLGPGGQVLRSRSGFLPADEKEIEQELLDAMARTGGQM